MNYTIVKGTYHVAGYSPDGDSVRFASQNPAAWDAFPWSSATNKKAAKKQLRLEGIDALETHYEESHQPRAVAVAALEILLSLLGIQDVVFNLSVTNITAAKDKTPGFLAVMGLDKFDRPVSLVFWGETKLKDGDSVDFSKLPMNQCLNLQLLKLGLAYPTYYDSMPPELMDTFTKAVKTARKNKTGIWALDRTKNFAFLNASTIVNDVVILPKLFRRLTTFLQNASDFSELGDYLKKTGDKITLRSTGAKSTLADLITIDGRRVHLATDPEDIVFDSKA